MHVFRDSGRQSPAAQRLHDDHPQAFAGRIFQPRAAGLEVFVHEVVLNLAERPIVGVHDRLEARRIVMEGEARVLDPPVGYRRVQEFGDAEPAELLPQLSGQAVHEVEVNMIRLQPCELLVQVAVHVGPALNKPTGQLGRQVDCSAAGLQGPAQEQLAHACLEGHFRVVNVGRVEVIHPVADGIIHHRLGLFFVNQVGLVVRGSAGACSQIPGSRAFARSSRLVGIAYVSAENIPWP